MTAFDPVHDRLDVFSQALNDHAEVSAFTLVSKALAAGTGIAITLDPASGHVTINNTGGGSSGGSSATVPYAVAGGTAIAVTATYMPTTAGPGAGSLFSVKLAYDIAGATTFDPDAHGALALVDAGNNALTSGFAKTGDLLLIEFDGTAYRVISKTTGTGAPTYPLAPAIGSYAIGEYYTPDAGGPHPPGWVYTPTHYYPQPYTGTVSSSLLDPLLKTNLPGSWQVVSILDPSALLVSWGSEGVATWPAVAMAGKHFLALYQRVA
jgi:hypothetical protein